MTVRPSPKVMVTPSPKVTVRPSPKTSVKPGATAVAKPSPNTTAKPSISASASAPAAPRLRATPKPSAKATVKPGTRAAPKPKPTRTCRLAAPNSRTCLTARSYTALKQARAAGFTRYTACWRPASWGEHPLGRACDFAVATTGFAGRATGQDRQYGDRLARYFIANANRLGVYYVIWYKRIWINGMGWQRYHGDDSRSGDHTNHVHVSLEKG